MTRSIRSSVPLALAGALSLPGALEAQSDVELLGKIHGTRPPAAYYEMVRRDPTAFQFERGVWGQARLVRRRAEMLARPGPGLFRAEALAGVSAASGSFAFPMVLGLYSDTPNTPFPLVEIQAEFWDGPNSRYETIPEFYDEISGSRVDLTGVTYDWATSTLTREEVTGGVSGLGSSARVGTFITQLLDAADAQGVDWGQFDNDGPDGVPNSADDDGFVDVLVVVHPTAGAECTGDEEGDRIWSHRWALSGWGEPIFFSSWPSNSAENSSGVVKINDYTIQPVYACNERDINHIGVFAHELGHGFGLPDLYADPHAGIGNWGLMGTGSWGCDGSSPQRPCHPNAWSKAVLGWVDVETLAPGGDFGTVTLPPVGSTLTAYRVDAGDGSGDYYLLENRQPVGFDALLYEAGLLVWKIDGEILEGPWYGINSDQGRMGVWLQQADDLDQLASEWGGRGDAGDPFPGSTGNTAFHAGSAPASLSHQGTATGLTLLDIEAVGEDVQFRLLTRFQSLNLRSVGAGGTEGLIAVDGVTVEGVDPSYPSAPGQSHQIEATPGIVTSPGYRTSFQGWEDGSPREREYTTGLSDTTLTATYGGEEVLITMDLQGPVEGVEPGSVSYTPGSEDGWVPRNTEIVVEAVPRTGFGFVAWTGPLSGHPNPTVTQWSEPSSAGASFDLTFSVAGNPETLQVEAAANALIALHVENANYPLTWALTQGTLPEGMTFLEHGQIVGPPMETGAFPLHLRVVDAIGLTGEIDLELSVVAPQLSLEALASRFLLKPSELTLNQEEYLDLVGNGDGGYDIGDMRAFVLANPGLPASGSSQRDIQRIDLRFGLTGSREPPRAGGADPGQPSVRKGGAR